MAQQWEYKKETGTIECPICHEQVDHLVGENTKDGGVQGCEKDWKAPTPVEGGEQNVQSN